MTPSRSPSSCCPGAHTRRPACARDCASPHGARATTVAGRTWSRSSRTSARAATTSRRRLLRARLRCHGALRPDGSWRACVHSNTRSPTSRHRPAARAACHHNQPCGVWRAAGVDLPQPLERIESTDLPSWCASSRTRPSPAACAAPAASPISASRGFAHRSGTWARAARAASCAHDSPPPGCPNACRSARVQPMPCNFTVM